MSNCKSTRAWANGNSVDVSHERIKEILARFSLIGMHFVIINVLGTIRVQLKFFSEQI